MKALWGNFKKTPLHTMMRRIDRADADGLLRHGMLMLTATQICNFANLVFQVVMMRRLADAEYSALAALLGIINVIATPLEALRTAAAQFTARLRQQKRLAEVPALLKKWRRRLFIVASLIFALGALCAPTATAFLKIPSSALIMLTAATIAAGLFLPPYLGILQGVEAFGWLAAATPAWGIGRLVLGILFTAWFTPAAAAGLIAQIGGILLTLMIAAMGLQKIALPAAATEIHGQRDSCFYLGGTFLALLGFAVLMTADVAVVKRFFAPEAAGIFARAAGIARLVIFLPIPIALAMFPKVVAEKDAGTSLQRATFHRALFCSIALAGAGALVAGLGADWLWRIFNGRHADLQALKLLRVMPWAFLPLAPTNMMLNFELAQNRLKAAIAMMVMAGIYAAGMMLFHENFWQIIGVIAATAIISLAIMAALTLHRHSEISPSHQ